MIIMAAIVEWAHKAKSRAHITVGVCSERLQYVVTSKHVLPVWEKLFLLSKTTYPDPDLSTVYSFSCAFGS